MKQIRKHVTYANVMSSLAVFLMLGGATAFAAKKIGANQLKANSVKTGKIVKEAVTAGKIKNGAVIASKLGAGAVTASAIGKEAVTTEKIAKNAVTTEKINKEAVTSEKLAKNAVLTNKIADDAVTGAKVKESTLGEVPQAANALALGGTAASGYAKRLFARVQYNDATPSIIASSPGVVPNGEGALGFPRIIFPQSVTNCAVVGGANTGSGNQIVRRSSSVTGAQVQMAIHDDAGALVRADYEVIVLC